MVSSAEVAYAFFLAERGCLEDITLKDNPHLTLQRLDSPFKKQERDKTYP